MSVERSMLWTLVYIVVGVVSVLVVAGIVLNVVGRTIPEEHTATSKMNLSGPIEPVFRLVEDLAGYPKWAPGVTGFEPLPPTRGLETCRLRMGRNAAVMTRTRHEPPRRVEFTIQDECGPFSGTWAFTVEERDEERCQVRLTETGRIRSAIARAMIKYVFGYHCFTHKHLRGLAKALGQDATPHRA